MGYIKPLVVTRYDFPSDPEYYFDWKSFITYGEMKAAGDAAIAAMPKDPTTGEIKTDPELAQRAMMAAYINSWNVTDEAGNVLPINADALKLLVDVDFNAIAGLFQDRMTKTATERKN